MSKYIGVAVALAVVGFAFLNINPYRIAENEADSPGLSLPSLSFNLPSLAHPGINNPNDSQAGDEAFAVFQKYLAFAQAHDLEGLRGISHQLSPACSNQAREAECFELMDSVYYFASNFKKNDFKNVYADERQVVMTTDYMEGTEGTLNKTVLYFTRIEEKLRVLAIRFCFGTEGMQDECVETDPAKRDLNGNGWWDDVEAFFR